MHFHYRFCRDQHKELQEQVRALKQLTTVTFKAYQVRPHLEELYALRLYFDSLYPPAPAEPEGEVPCATVDIAEST